MTELGTKIIALKKNKSYQEICDLLGCSKATVNYYLSPNGKEKLRKREQGYRNKLANEMRELLGNCCEACGYSRCPQALDFHHKDPTTKLFGIAEAIGSRRCKFTKTEIQTEVLKCQLLCANCHRELHAGWCGGEGS